MEEAPLKSIELLAPRSVLETRGQELFKFDILFQVEHETHPTKYKNKKVIIGVFPSPVRNMFKKIF